MDRITGEEEEKRLYKSDVSRNVINEQLESVVSIAKINLCLERTGLRTC